MKELLATIIERELGETPRAIRQIVGLGIVNEVYEILGNHKAYVIRMNAEIAHLTEYKKEAWCLKEVHQLAINCPEVLALGQEGSAVFMIQEKIEGINGSQVSDDHKLIIWRKLGQYARRYSRLQQIDVAEVQEQEFHSSWRARLRYNIAQLMLEDRLLKRGVFDAEEHKQAASMLQELEEKDFTEGLIHGDACPRNVIMSGDEVHILDWGTAEINVVPHHEIGLVILSKEANEEEFDTFLSGYEISQEEYEKMLPDIMRLNVLHRLDKYRWAESYDAENLADYEMKIREAFEAVLGCG